jgi:hypothetical protein
MLRVAGDVCFSEKNHHIARGFALDIHAAKKADGVMHPGVWSYVNVRAELNHIPVGTGRGSRKGGGEQKNGEKALDHYINTSAGERIASSA